MSESVTAAELNRLTSTIIAAAIKVHRALGPGLLESVYAACLCYELRASGLTIEVQKVLPLVYEALTFDFAFRVDVIVEGKVLVEIKAVDAIAPVHLRQLNTYLKLSDARVGLLLNFGASSMKEGIRRVVNGFPSE